jgi:hypothetical protein
MESDLLLLGGIFVWTGLCFYWRATKAVADSSMWVILILGYLVGFFVAFGLVPDLDGDPIEMSFQFVISVFGVIGLVAAVGGAFVGDRLGSKA